MRYRFVALLGVTIVIAGACGRGGGGGGGTPSAHGPAARENSIDVRMVDFGYVPRGAGRTGELTVNFTNDGKEPHMAVIARLSGGKTVQDLLTEIRKGTQGPPPPWFHDAPADEPLITPGQSSGVVIDASKPGTYVMLCFVTDPKTHKPHVALGMAGGFEVRPSTAPVLAPKPDATFRVTGSGLKTSDLSAGRSVIAVTGVTGSSQLMVAKFEPGKTLKDLGPWFNRGLVGKPPATIYGGTSVAAGATGFATFDLQPGTYTAIVSPRGKGRPITATFKVT